MYKKNFAILVFVMLAFSAMGQHPLKYPADAVEIRYALSQPVVGYTLQVDSTDLSAFDVEMRIRNVHDTFEVAMVAHPEYDDRFWQYVENLSVETKNGKGNIIREDSALWRIVAHDDEVVLRYKIHLPIAPEGQRAAWRPFLSSTGGLVGGPHSFMYVVGATLTPSHITLKLPHGWMSATGLETNSDPYTFFAPSTHVLIDAPILIGKFKSWPFTVDQVPHRVIYWSLPNAVSFDTATLVNYIHRLVEDAKALFGRLPYREYTFLLQDSAFGALEHLNSVTIGVSSSQLSKNINSYLGEIAHEYFHTWNLMRIHPVEYGDVSYTPPPLSKGLWFSEGLTIFYSDLLLRRAGLPVFDSTRLTHLEGLIRRYSANPAYLKFSAEKISLAAYGPIGMLGDYSAGTHLQGEVLGSMLDLIIRDATKGKSSMDDVMRKMMERFSGEKGFTSKDIEKTITDVCGCNVHQFFHDHVYGNKQIEFNKYLRLIGLQYQIEWKDVLLNAGKSAPDLRIYSYQLPGENITRIGITNPTSCWAKAGLHTGDIIKTMNKSAIKSVNDFRQIIRRIRIGDTVSIEIQRPTGILQRKVTVSGYKQPIIRIEEINEATQRQRNLRAVWEY